MKTLLQSIAFLSLILFTDGLARAQDAAVEVMQADEAWRIAKLKQDLPVLERMMADGFYEMNQNGNGRNKAETLDLWKGFSIQTLTTDSHEVRVVGDTAMVTGTQTENGYEKMLFTRVYVKRAGGWQVLSSMQYRNPQPVPELTALPRVPALNEVASAVMFVDETYRMAKLNRDTRVMEQILADAFNETNQNGNSRNKAETLELWKTFAIATLTTDTFEVRPNGNTVVVTGTQTENGSERMLFARVYINSPTGWQLLSSMQFRNPKAAFSRLF